MCDNVGLYQVIAKKTCLPFTITKEIIGIHFVEVVPIIINCFSERQA